MNKSLFRLLFSDSSTVTSQQLYHFQLLIREEWEREQRKLELEAAKREEERENRKREQVIDWFIKHLKPGTRKRYTLILFFTYIRPNC